VGEGGGGGGGGGGVAVGPIGYIEVRDRGAEFKRISSPTDTLAARRRGFARGANGQAAARLDELPLPAVGARRKVCLDRCPSGRRPAIGELDTFCSQALARDCVGTRRLDQVRKPAEGCC